MRPDQLAPGQHVKDMGGGWVVLSADFLCWGAGLSSPKPEPPPKAKRVSKAVKATTTNWKRK